MVQRTEYLERLKAWREKQVIKVVTGIRRCGKTTLLRQYRDELLSTGVSQEQIIFLNFEELENEELQDYHKLYSYITERLDPDRFTYIFLDEIQKVDSFEKAVDSLYVKERTDIYITGSNAYMLSGELATLLSGRYVEISMLPLSFAEYSLLRSGAPDELFAEYMRTGGFPYIAQMDDVKEKAEIYLEGIYNTIIVKDIEERQKRRETDPNKRKISDLTLLKNIARFLAGSIGSPISVKSISNYITSSGRRVSANTISDYVSALTEAFIFYPAERYDIIGKQALRTNQKLYIVDLGIRNHLLPRRHYDLGFSLENIVFFELLRRGFKVSVGKIDSAEVDFIAQKNGRLHYYQVTASLTDENTFNREITPLKSLADNYPKTILTLDRFSLGDYEGIEVINAVDWLLEKE